MTQVPMPVTLRKKSRKNKMRTPIVIDIKVLILTLYFERRLNYNHSIRDVSDIQ